MHLTLFAEMVKSRPWVPATLEAVGGTEGIGVSFLEETFSTREANPDHRAHQGAAREVLKVLLPEHGANIKGHMRSHAELLKASGYGNRPHEFRVLLRILDGELRLITPTDPEGAHSQSVQEQATKYYQLTHDFLVPSLREWLTSKQKETPRGRAQLRLAEHAASWNRKPETRHLPSLWEWGAIHLLTSHRHRTEPERKMLRTADRRYLFFGLVGFVFAVSLAAAGREARCRFQAAGLVDALCTAEMTEVPWLVQKLARYRRWADPSLARMVQEALEGSREQLHARMALLPVDSGQLEHIFPVLLREEPEHFRVLRDFLQPYSTSLM